MKNTLLITLSLLLSSVTFAQDFMVFEKKEFKYKTGNLLYRQLSPETEKPDWGREEKKFPLVIFFHGAGERGNDNEKQLIHGTKLFADKANFEKNPCFFIAPQCPEEMQWVDVSWKLKEHSMPESPSQNMQLVLDLIEKMINEYPIDTNRIYVSGLSMGGFAVWDIISRYPDKFAAAIPICGGGDEEYAMELVNIPIWAFHGGKDKLVLTSRSQNMIYAIENAGGSPKYTEYPKLGHLSWNAAYAEPELLNWLFSQSLKN